MIGIIQERLNQKIRNYNNVYSQISDFGSANLDLLTELSVLFQAIEKDIEDSFNDKFKTTKEWVELRDKNYQVVQKRRMFFELVSSKRELIIKKVKDYFGSISSKINITSYVDGKIKKAKTIKDLNLMDIEELISGIKADIMIKNSAVFEILKDVDSDTEIDISQLKEIGDSIAADYFCNLAFSEFIKEKFDQTVEFGTKKIHRILTPADAHLVEMQPNQILIFTASIGEMPEGINFTKVGEEIPSSYPGILHNNKYVVKTPYHVFKKDRKTKVHVFNDVYAYVNASIYVGFVVAQLSY